MYALPHIQGCAHVNKQRVTAVTWQVKCMMPLGMNACDRCARKGLLCEQIKWVKKYKGPKRERQIKAVHSSNSTARPGAPRCDKVTLPVTIPELPVTNQEAPIPSWHCRGCSVLCR